ncbi:hypothetical protein PVAND_001252 [Polypedilum vanderplanki]|uniref:Uncharacterized protein n=1 Tax=Polypedilum vanderplanki TaxID=319348 RepID=A0A9J6BMN3_POLVA|nr:hypothetical protein PVAND_001252 [Polypedilum vanderplanki]
MRIILLVALTALAGCALGQHDHGVRSRFFNQPVDHFNPFDRRNFDQRFLENSEFFQDGGPIYIYLTVGERFFGVYDTFITSGLVYDIAEETNGLLIAIEHRYFGVSRPTVDTSFQNLQWLNIHQTLADVARFIAHLKENRPGAENSRVILWGRGYGGSLAIWARQKYPHLIDGAWGSSAVLDATVEYPQALANAYTTVNNIGGPECAAVIRGAFEMIDEAFMEGNTSYVQERLRLCYDLDSGNVYDLARLDYSIALESYLFIQNARYPEIDEKCIIMTGLNTPDDPPLNPLDGFARWYIDDLQPNRDCFDYSNDAVTAQYTDPTWDSISTIDGRRQKLWLRCTQLGAFTTSEEGSDHPYGRRFDIRFFRRWCADAFGFETFTDPWFMQDFIGLTNEHFGGLNPKVYRILITQGEMDPLRTLSPLEDLNSQARVIVINLESFSRDMGSVSEVQDYPHLIEVKGIIREEILRWIQASEQEQPTPPPPTTTPPPIEPGRE